MKYLLLVVFLIFSFQNISAQGVLRKVREKAEEKVLGSKEPSKENQEDKSEPEKEETDPADKKTDTSNSVSAYRKFLFVRGDKLIYSESFEEDQIGDYPKRWISDAGGEVVALSNQPGKWLRSLEIANHGADFLESLPLNFTMELDVISDAKDPGDYNDISIMLVSTVGGSNFNKAMNEGYTSGFTVNFDFFKPWMTYENYWKFPDDSINRSFVRVVSPVQADLSKFDFNGKPLHISFTRQDSRLVMYINSTRMFDIRNAFAKQTTLNNLIITTGSKLDNPNSGLYFSNLIIAEAGADNRKDLFVNGKYVTNAILFATNSDKLLPSSLPVVAQMAAYLKEKPEIKLQVVGHTDNVGEDKSNLDLSVRRAKSVVKELVEYHKIDASRLQAAGKGETEPVTDNNSPESRAKNRRVEFIQL